MLNFRKLRQDFSSNIVKDGKDLFDKSLVVGAKILHFDSKTIRLSCRVKGSYENVYESEIEIDRNESSAVDSNCDCPYTYDCQHIAAAMFYLEHNLDEILVNYSKETNLEQQLEKIDDDEKQQLRETFEEAATKETFRKDVKYQKELLTEYIGAAKILGDSSFFLPQEELVEDKGELAIIFTNSSQQIFDHRNSPEIQLALRLPFRSKPLYITNLKAFLDAIRYREPIHMGGKKYFFTLNSFDAISSELLSMIIDHARFYNPGEEKYLRLAQLELDVLGTILAQAFDLAIAKMPNRAMTKDEQDALPMPSLYSGNLEEPLCFSLIPAQIRFVIEYLDIPGPSILLKPTLIIQDEPIPFNEGVLFESAKPGIIYKNTYYRFQPHIKRIHLKSLPAIRDMTIPEPLFGTFIENALPIVQQYADVTTCEEIESFVTLPYVESIKGRCEINYLNGELETKLFFNYDKKEIPAALSELEYQHTSLFITKQGIMARNLVEERQIVNELFQDFVFDEKEGLYRAKSEKKIVEFMTEVIPRNQHRIKFECPENLSEQFIYDESSFELQFTDSSRVDSYDVTLKVNGYLKGINLDLLWECIASKKTFVELENNQTKAKKGKTSSKMPRILVLDLEKITPIVQIFDEIGIVKLEDHTESRPLWSLASINEEQFKGLPIKFSMTKRLEEIQKQILGETAIVAKKIPEEIQATLRKYQVEGVHWLERLRCMHLNGILADDMGLGKTLQAIIAVTQSIADNQEYQSLVVCPTSLVYNWKEEFNKFNPQLKTLVVDNIPSHRKKLLKDVKNYHVVITSYNLLQKDVEIYNKLNFNYVILDEAQHIKNRGTRNARSVKMIQSNHRLILTGTPIENSLDELWSLFDFLMPGLLSSYDRFVEKYIRTCGHGNNSNLESLRRKVSPFILRRMKEDVLDDLPPVSEIIYHCHLSDIQKELYQSYAASAKEELSRLVSKEGFEKVQIHVLATLTRLKQICCHPAIFAKEKPEDGDSSKYDMLMELLRSLVESKHKTVIFSQYTRMLTIMRDDLEQRGIKFSYLDGSSKNRSSIVHEFNDDPSISIFLVSLKAGGTGLNLVGADTVIHYDMWWNPAVENQATDRVHRIGQKRSVSSYKLITLNTIEEKIVNLQNRKKGLVKKVVSCDDEAMTKLTWEEVLELLQT